MAEQTKSDSPVVIGEVLFDCFPDGSSILGGAPFNVAWHMHGFGLFPVMISAVGDDALGNSVMETMQSWGMSMQGMQLDRHHPTGQVTVSFNDGQPSYEICQDQAYDNINAGDALNSVKNKSHGLLYHGTLIKRTAESKTLVENLIQQISLPVFVDINLRPPWWNIEEVIACFDSATWVKLNDEELMTVSSAYGKKSDNLHEQAKALRARFDLQLLIVTMGDSGAFCVTPDNIVSGEPVKAQVVDTVGAGDAFSAVTILGLIRNWPIDVILDRALVFAAKICEQRGATTRNQAMYDEFLSRWLEVD